MEQVPQKKCRNQESHRAEDLAEISSNYKKKSAKQAGGFGQWEILGFSSTCFVNSQTNDLRLIL